jgi:CO/xanthine dehydrogenase FAD-binding subunit
VTVFMPTTLTEALEVRRDQVATPMAGGTDLLVHWPEQLELHDRDYLDLWGINELRRIEWSDDTLELGALTTYWDVITDAKIGAAFPLLVDAARQIGAVQIQSRGTWAGNIANGSPAADGVPVLMAYDASVVIASHDKRRQVPLERFYSGYKEMDLAPDELIVAIRIPNRTYRHERFIKVGSRRAQAIAKVGAAIVSNGSGWRVVASSVAPTIRRCPTIEAQISDGESLGSPDDLLPAIRADVSPIDDLRSTAAYRERVMSRILYYAIEEMSRR